MSTILLIQVMKTAMLERRPEKTIVLVIRCCDCNGNDTAHSARSFLHRLILLAYSQSSTRIRFPYLLTRSLVHCSPATSLLITRRVVDSFSSSSDSFVLIVRSSLAFSLTQSCPLSLNDSSHFTFLTIKIRSQRYKLIYQLINV